MKRPILALIALCSLLLVAAGCGGNKNSTGATGSTGGETKETKAPAYPTKPIDLIVAYAPGGSTDVVARALADELSKKWKQPVNVVNKEGASGATGLLEVKKAKPDGHTLLISIISYSTNPAVVKELPYKWDDLDFVAQVVNNPLVAVVKGDSPYKSLKDLMDAMKKDPSKFTYGTSGKAGSSAFASAQIAEKAGVDPTKLTGVVFNGGAKAVQAVASGDVDFAVQYVSEVGELVKGGKLRALAVTSPARVKALPDVPVGKEAGAENLTYQGWIGVSAPKGTPKEVVDVWNQTLKALLADKAFAAKMEDLGNAIAYLPPEDFKKAAQKDYDFAVQMNQKLGLDKQ